MGPEVRSYSSPQRQVARVWENSDAGSRAGYRAQINQDQPTRPGRNRDWPLAGSLLPNIRAKICVRILARRFAVFRSDEARGSERRYKPSPPFVLRVFAFSPSLASTPCRPSRTCSRRSRQATATLSRTLWLVASPSALATTSSHPLLRRNSSSSAGRSRLPGEHPSRPGTDSLTVRTPSITARCRH